MSTRYPIEDYIHKILIFHSFYLYRHVERKKIDFSRWPFKGCTDMHQKIQLDGLTGRCRLAGNSESHRENSIFFLLYFSISERNKISKDKECNLRQLSIITTNSVWPVSLKSNLLQLALDIVDLSVSGKLSTIFNVPLFQVRIYFIKS